MLDAGWFCALIFTLDGQTEASLDTQKWKVQNIILLLSADICTFVTTHTQRWPLKGRSPMVGMMWILCRFRNFVSIERAELCGWCTSSSALVFAQPQVKGCSPWCEKDKSNEKMSNKQWWRASVEHRISKWSGEGEGGKESWCTSRYYVLTRKGASQMLFLKDAESPAKVFQRPALWIMGVVLSRTWNWPVGDHLFSTRTMMKTVYVRYT